MKHVDPPKTRMRIWRILAILIPVLTTLFVLALILLDKDAGELSTRFRYQLY